MSSQLKSQSITAHNTSRFYRHWIYLLDGSHQQANELMNNLYNNGFQVRCFKDINEICKACENRVPLAMLYIADSFPGASSVETVIKRLEQQQISCPPIIFISARKDMKARLEAVSAGALRYFTWPVNLAKLNNTLSRLSLQAQHEPPRILMVDDDEDLLVLYEKSLKKQGMDVMTLSDSMRALQVLEEYKPDLVLLDVNMPLCSGLQLAKIVRQDDEYMYIPIIFLSEASEQESQLDAVLFGGDVFIQKSVQPVQLAELILSRIDRIKAVKQLNRQLQLSLKRNNERRIALDEHAIVSMTDASGTIVSVNAKFCEISGYSQAELIGNNHRMLKSGRHDPAFYEEMWETISNGNIWHGEVCNRRKGGGNYWVEATIVPLLDGGGLPYQYVSVRTEITHLIEVEESLKKHQIAMECSADGMAIANPAGEYVYMNPAHVHIYGYSSVYQLLNRQWRSLYAQEQLEKFEHEILPQLQVTGNWSGEINGRRENGEAFPQSLTLSQLDDGGLIFVVRDISQEKAAARALAENEERLTNSQRYANIGTWDWDIQSGDLHWSERIGPLFGYQDVVPATTYENFLAAVHPDDRQLVIDAVTDCAENGADYDIEHRVVWQDGTIRWLAERGDVTRSEDGRPLHMLGVVRDITKRKELEARLALQKSVLELLRAGMNHYLNVRNIKQTSDYLLGGILSLTDSEFGFAGEILIDSDSAPYLKMHAMSNIAWDEASLKYYESEYTDGMEFHNLENLVGEVIRNGNVVISNDPANDQRSGGLPQGHPPITSFIGIPIYYGNKLNGMLGLANRPEGYDTSISELLQPFGTTYGAMIESMHAYERERKSQMELIKAKEEAESANRAKSQFLSSMSHELRTPMNSIIGFGQLLQMDTENTLTEDQQSSVAEILRAGGHLLKLINEILDLAKIEAGRIDLFIESVPLREIINDCLGLIAPLAMKHEVEILLAHNGENFKETELRTLDTMLETDNVRLRQVLLNLMSNAVKYNYPGGKVVIDISTVAVDRLRIKVTDTGPGIKEEHQVQLFQSFNRLGAERSEIEGTGIGLVITRNIVEVMGGSIGFESVAGEGSTFWVELPIDGNTSNGYADAPAAGTEEDKINRDQAEHTVLYIEDNPANLRLVTQLLQQNRKKIKLVSAHEPYLGLDLAVKHDPSLILLDINLPGMDGFEVLKRLRTQSRVPVFAISASAMPSDIEAGLAAGFDNYLTKPINVAELLRLVDEALSNVE